MVDVLFVYSQPILKCCGTESSIILCDLIRVASYASLVNNVLSKTLIVQRTLLSDTAVAFASKWEWILRDHFVVPLVMEEMFFVQL